MSEPSNAASIGGFPIGVSGGAGGSYVPAHYPLYSSSIGHSPITCDFSPTIGKLALALSKAQTKIKGAVRDSSNPYFKSQYADLASTWDACHEALNGNEIAIVQVPCDGLDHVSVITMLVHSSGEWMRGKLSVTAKAKDAQATGSVITYLRRYMLAAMTGVAPIDDDGEAAVGRVAKAPVVLVSEDTMSIIEALVTSTKTEPADLEAYIRKTFKHGWDALTQPEADKLVVMLEKKRVVKKMAEDKPNG